MRDGWTSHHELSTRYAIIDPIIRSLGWRTSDPWQCEVEYPRANQGNVDYVFLDPDEKIVVLVEAKSWGKLDNLGKDLEDGERQLSGYALGITSGVAVLTDGQYWRLYDLDERGPFSEKLFNVVDITEGRSIQPARELHEALNKRRWW